MDGQTEHDSTASHGGPALIRVGFLVLVVGVSCLIGYRLGWFDYRHTLQHIERLRGAHTFPIFVTVFLIVYAIGASTGVPALPFTVAGGVLFGTLLGSVLAWVGGMLGATIGYWLARTIGRDAVVRSLQRFRRVHAAVRDARDFDGMLRLRLVPVLTLGTVSFVCGLARAPFWSYLGATALGVIPSTVIYAYFADSLLERVGNGRREALTSLIIASLLLLALSLAPRFLKQARAN